MYGRLVYTVTYMSDRLLTQETRNRHLTPPQLICEATFIISLSCRHSYHTIHLMKPNDIYTCNCPEVTSTPDTGGDSDESSDSGWGLTQP